MNKFILVIATLLLYGCTNYARMTYEFEQLNETPTIFYDAEEKDIATQVSNTLPASISSVKKKQYIEYKDIDALKVYVFSSKERYANFSGSSPKARGSATKNEVYISPIIKKRIDTLEQILAHELSHVHLRQYIGTWRYWTEVPGWFHEGLAVEVSGGGGAEKVTEAQAIAAIKSNDHFIPREKSSFLGHKFASSYGLKPHMYYRQSNLFVRYLINQNPEAFKKAYLNLINGTAFKDIWILNYGKSIPELWQEYLDHVQT